MHLTQEEVGQVWARAQTQHAVSDPEVRVDGFGAYIRFSDYGEHSSDYGWVAAAIHADHPTDIAQLEPLHWKTDENRQLGRAIPAVRGERGVNITVGPGREHS